MAKKKLYVTMTASAVIASGFFANQAEAASYKVQPGDTLWHIAKNHQTSVSSLKAWNNLSGDLIFPNQVIHIKSSADSEGTHATDQSNSKEQADKSLQDTSSNNQPLTYTVKRGDTLSHIALAHNVTWQQLMEWNNLNSTLIYPGNVLKVSDPSQAKDSGTEGSAESRGGDSGSDGSDHSGSSDQGSDRKTDQSGADHNGSVSNPNDGIVGSVTVYTVKSGDTLSHIAREYGVTVQQLKDWNHLTSDLILIGQKLTIGEGAVSDDTGRSGERIDTDAGDSDTPSVVEMPVDVDQLLNVAEAMLGVPYAWAGTTPNGFDCSGFIYYAYKQAGMDIKRLDTSGYYSRSYYVDKPQVGDLVFFENTYRRGISHMGIYIGNNQFVHAGTSTGVTIANLNNSYWQSHFDGFKRFY